MGLPASGRGNVGGGDQGGGDILPLPLEHCGSVYCDLSDNGDIPGNRMADGRMYILRVVGVGRH